MAQETVLVSSITVWEENDSLTLRVELGMFASLLLFLLINFYCSRVALQFFVSFYCIAR